MINQITEKSIGFRVRFHLFYSTKRFMFFEITDSSIADLAEYLDKFRREAKYPKGIYDINTIVQNKVFQIQYNESEITEEQVIKYANSIGL